MGKLVKYLRKGRFLTIFLPLSVFRPVASVRWVGRNF